MTATTVKPDDDRTGADTATAHNDGTHGTTGAPPSRTEQILIGVFIAVPFLAVLAAIPVAWGGLFSWVDAALLVSFYTVSSLGITVGFHRLFTHKAFKPNRAVKVAFAGAGNMAIQGPVIRWVADHRKHHKFSDREGDPHSPWRYGNSFGALVKGFVYAHIGWLFDAEQTPQRQYAPDLLKDDDIVRVSRAFPAFVLFSLLGPAVIGGLVTMSWQGALTGFFWGALVRVFLLHHVTWSINSICHMVGDRPFKSRDRSANVWWLAIPSMGESWHNLHHADPTCARHGVLPGQLDMSARTIWFMEKFGWIHDVRWPVASRVESKRVSP